MANIIKIKRGLKADIDKLILSAGELGVTLDTQELYVGDQNGEKQLIKGAAAGVVESAEKLSTARNIKISGDATGSASFDGSADATIALTLANSGVTAGTYNNVTVNAKGLVTSASNKVYEISDISGLQDALDDKANAADVYTQAEIDSKISTINTSLNSKASQSALSALNDTVTAQGTAISTIQSDLENVYTKTETDDLLDTKANKSDVYTAAYIDTALAAKANTADLGDLASKDEVSESELASALVSKINAAATQTYVDTELAKKATVTALETLSSTVDGKADKATTLSGYGITDAYTKTQVDGMIAGTFHFEGEVDSYDSLPSDAEKGDVYQVGDKEYAWDGDSWVELGFNIDLSEYAKTADVAATYATITTVNTKANASDVYTKTEADAAFMTNAEVEAKGYATTTALTEGLATKADKATTLSGYGITDAYTKTEVDTALAKKADSATTLAGYGITNAYTKTEVDSTISTITTTLATKLDASSTIDGGTF